MSEFINDLLMAVITVCVPILATYLVKMINKLTKSDKINTDNELAKSHLTEIAQAVTTAVSYTSQTYVDALKASGTFTMDAQKQALEKSIATALSILTPAATSFIEEVYGDAKEYIVPLIEAEVRNQKMTVGVPLEAISITE